MIGSAEWRFFSFPRAAWECRCGALRHELKVIAASLYGKRPDIAFLELTGRLVVNGLIVNPNISAGIINTVGVRASPQPTKAQLLPVRSIYGYLQVLSFMLC